MSRFFKTNENEILFWEAIGADINGATTYSGKVGVKGELEKKLNRAELEKEVPKLIAEGYKKIAREEYKLLLVEFEENNSFTRQDKLKRAKLIEKLDVLLFSTHLGECDEDTEAKTKNVVCAVIDFNIAKKLIEENLKGTEFSDYTGILLAE